MIYKNLSRTTKTFYGITFKPGESHDVPGYINCSKFVRDFRAETSDKATQSAEQASKLTESASQVTEPMVTKSSARTKATKKEELTNGTDCDQ